MMLGAVRLSTLSPDDCGRIFASGKPASLRNRLALVRLGDTGSRGALIARGFRHASPTRSLGRRLKDFNDSAAVRFTSAFV